MHGADEATLFGSLAINAKLTTFFVLYCLFFELIKELELLLLFNFFIPLPNGCPGTYLGETTAARCGELFVMSVKYSKQRRCSAPTQTAKDRNRITPGTGLLWFLGSGELNGIFLIN